MVWITDFDAVRKASNKRLGKSDNVDVRDIGFNPFGINKTIRDTLDGGSPELKKSRKRLKKSIEVYKKIYKELLKTPKPDKTGNFTKEDLLALGFKEYEKPVGISMAGGGLLPTGDIPLLIPPGANNSSDEEQTYANNLEAERFENISIELEEIVNRDSDITSPRRFQFKKQGGLADSSGFQQLLNQLLANKRGGMLRFRESTIQDLIKKGKVKYESEAKNKLRSRLWAKYSNQILRIIVEEAKLTDEEVAKSSYKGTTLLDIIDGREGRLGILIRINNRIMELSGVDEYMDTIDPIESPPMNPNLLDPDVFNELGGSMVNQLISIGVNKENASEIVTKLIYNFQETHYETIHENGEDGVRMIRDVLLRGFMNIINKFKKGWSVNMGNLGRYVYKSIKTYMTQPTKNLDVSGMFDLFKEILNDINSTVDGVKGDYPSNNPSSSSGLPRGDIERQLIPENQEGTGLDNILQYLNNNHLGSVGGYQINMPQTPEEKSSVERKVDSLINGDEKEELDDVLSEINLDDDVSDSEDYDVNGNVYVTDRNGNTRVIPIIKIIAFLVAVGATIGSINEIISSIHNIDDLPPDQPDNPVGPDQPDNPEKPIGPNQDDDHTFVNYDQKDNHKFEPSIVDPAEAYLFLSTEAEVENERRLWDNYSKVQSGFGLGNVRQNSLARHNFEHEKKMFTGCYSNPQPKNNKVEVPYSSKKQPFWTPTIQNEYGNVTFDNAFEQKALQHFTTPIPENNNRQTFENSHSIYHPGFALDRMKYPFGRSVKIPETRSSLFYGLPQSFKPSQGYANNQEVMDTMYKYSKQMDVDCNPISNNKYSSYDIPRSGSSRMG